MNKTSSVEQKPIETTVYRYYRFLILVIYQSDICAHSRSGFYKILHYRAFILNQYFFIEYVPVHHTFIYLHLWIEYRKSCEIIKVKQIYYIIEWINIQAWLWSLREDHKPPDIRPVSGTWVATPNPPSLTGAEFSLLASSTQWGFRSRWIMLLAWQYLIASRICLK